MTTTQTERYEPDYAVPPGETLEETIEDLGMKQSELALRLDMSAKTVNLIIHGKAPITHETAIGLERVTGVSAGFWFKREAIYQERLARIEDAKRLEADLDWLTQFPRKQIREAGYIQSPRKGAEQLSEVLSFFGVSSRVAWEKHWKKFRERCNIAARKSAHFETSEPALAAWIRMGELQAQKVECRSFNLPRFKKAVKKCRPLTALDPTEFVPKMRELCTKSGVALVLVPEVPKVPWHGASWWMTPEKAVIELNLRGKAEDQFWFSFFHEAGHIAKQHSKKAVFLNNDSTDGPLEDQANEFAENLLFPEGCVEEIPLLENEQQMTLLAQRIGISPGIVAGQYQRLTRHFDRQWVHSLIRRFQWAAA